VHHYNVNEARTFKHMIELPVDLVHGDWAGDQGDFAGEVEARGRNTDRT
jgi:hypothetical protein